MTNTFTTPPSGLAIDYALDAAAERIANPDGCTCQRCEDAVTDVRRDLIIEGQRREGASDNWRDLTRSATEEGE